MQDEEVHEVNQVDALLLRRLGLETLPAHETLTLRAAQLLVPDAAHSTRSAKRLVKSIQQVGLLHNPAVVVQGERALPDPAATFAVIAGRRRVLAARLAGLNWITCEVYTASTVPFSALLTLIENEQRSAAWVKEVEALRRLLDDKVGLTMDDLAAFGFDKAQLSERLKIAQLPTPLLDPILAGSVSREVARKLVRLTPSQQERVATLAATGEMITAECVKDILRAQINTGLLPMQAQLAQGWNAPVHAVSEPALQRVCSPLENAGLAEERSQTGEEEVRAKACSAAASSSLVALLDALHTFEQSAEYRHVPQALRTLIIALVQQARLYLRDLPAQSIALADDEGQESLERSTTHV